MLEDLDTLIKNAETAVSKVEDLRQIDEVRVQFLGKKGQITALLKQLGNVTEDQRPQFGQKVNEAKQRVADIIQQRQQQLKDTALVTALAKDFVDVTLPGRGQNPGSLHPVTLVSERMESLFLSMGFDIVEGPEIEDDYHNFAALNIPEHHPARAMHDTFYFESGQVLRTHTSPVQIRVMKQSQPPLKIVTPGRVYRVDSDPTHTPMFHQLEGLVIDERANFAQLKGLLGNLMRCFFEEDLMLRFRPSYFPFTEPSAEVDIQCTSCKGAGCRLCSQSGWLEVLGCGMVHPNVLANVNIDSEKYAGYAFGIGLDRLAMLRYGIPDLRILFENDIRMLNQF